MKMPLMDTILDWIFPSACLSCGAWLSSGAVYCSECFARMPRFAALFCVVCRNRLSEGRKVCHKDAPYLLGAATDYRDRGVSALIAALKFKSNPKAAEPLAARLMEYAAGIDFGTQTLLIPIPLSRARLRERGFNQAELLARPLAVRFGIDYAPQALVRTKDTAPQSEIKNAEDRAKNVSDCFAVPDPAMLAGKNIILVDDVVTSGATLGEAARALKLAGARRVTALAAAKA